MLAFVSYQQCGKLICSVSTSARKTAATILNSFCLLMNIYKTIATSSTLLQVQIKA